jgi:hypothetical protein
VLFYSQDIADPVNGAAALAPGVVHWARRNINGD